jgi:hypothetical protein
MPNPSRRIAESDDSRELHCSSADPLRQPAPGTPVPPVGFLSRRRVGRRLRDAGDRGKGSFHNSHRRAVEVGSRGLGHLRGGIERHELIQFRKIAGYFLPLPSGWRYLPDLVRHPNSRGRPVPECGAHRSQAWRVRLLRSAHFASTCRSCPHTGRRCWPLHPRRRAASEGLPSDARVSGPKRSRKCKSSRQRDRDRSQNGRQHQRNDLVQWHLQNVAHTRPISR